HSSSSTPGEVFVLDKWSCRAQYSSAKPFDATSNPAGASVMAAAAVVAAPVLTSVSAKLLCVCVSTRALNAITSASALAHTHTPTLNRPRMDCPLPRLRAVALTASRHVWRGRLDPCREEPDASSPTSLAEAEGELRSATYCGDDHAPWTIEVLTRVDIACRELIENRSDELVSGS